MDKIGVTTTPCHFEAESREISEVVVCKLWIRRFLAPNVARNDMRGEELQIAEFYSKGEFWESLNRFKGFRGAYPSALPQWLAAQPDKLPAGVRR